MGDSAAKTLAHEIAVTLSTAFAQHRHATTSVPPMLLSCTAELQDKRALNGKLKGLPDWATISNDDSRISGHPLFNKTIVYKHLVPPASPPLVTTPLLTHPTPAPAPAAQASNSAHAMVAPALFPITTPAPPPPNPVSKPFNLLVPGNKCKALTSELDDDKEEPAPRPAKHLRVKLKKIISDDEDDEVLPMGVIYVKRAMPPLQLWHQQLQRVAAAKMPGSLQHLFNVAYVVVAAKKAGKVWKCCHTCDEKKTKCVWLDSDVVKLLCGHVTLKKGKAAATSEKKSQLAAEQQAKGSSSQAQS
ncbi:hypothetical protein EV424DRAFT_1534165 [Suillus variegatus]|nr:hypothetical protein EV424DRAFT_1534165 [Suillus variegatus]